MEKSSSIPNSDLSSHIKNGTISDEELNWLLENTHCGCKTGKEALILEYSHSKRGEELWKQVLTLNLTQYEALFCYHGISSRFEQFVSWLQKTYPNENEKINVKEIYRNFANYLGRITSYRALALTEQAFQTIKSNNTIWPSGRLKTKASVLRSKVQMHGIEWICYARLYIGLGLLPHDPSLSLHDDPETAVCIAEGYMNLEKKIYLMEMNIPKIEALGFIVENVQDKKVSERWFNHRGIWFDARLERTERYMLYEIPFFKERCTKVTIFDNKTQVKDFLEPFKLSQLAKKNQSEQV